MRISTKGRYALRVMVDLAENSNGKFISLKEIAHRQEISLKYLEQIVALLNKAHFLQATRGNSGGYKLAKAPCEYKIGDILRVTEGDLAPIGCVSGEECHRKENCRTYKFWQGLDDVIIQYMDHKTLEDLVK